MADPSQAADGGTLISGAAYAGYGATGILVLWRILVSFGRQDRASRMEAEIRENLRQQITELRERSVKADADLDRMANERNEAVQIRLQLATQLEMTAERLAQARAERDDAQARLARLQGEYERLSAVNHQLVEDVAIAEARDAPRSPAHGDQSWGL